MYMPVEREVVMKVTRRSAIHGIFYLDVLEAAKARNPDLVAEKTLCRCHFIHYKGDLLAPGCRPAKR